MGVFVNEEEQEWSNRQCDQRELPVDIRHQDKHADQGQQVDDGIHQGRGNKALNGVDVACDAANQVACLAPVVEGK